MWSTIDLGDRWYPASANYFYQLSYVPSKRETGKCHTVKVAVDQPHAAVFATDQYCYEKHPPSDPLDGTTFGKQMASDLNLDDLGKIPLAMQATYFYTNPQSARVDIVLSFAWNHLDHEWIGTDLHATIGVLGMIFRTDRTMVTRFSDFACCATGSRMFHTNPQPAFEHLDDAGEIPSNYDTQVDLPPGEYDFELILSDKRKFGRAVTHLNIYHYDGKQLATSSIVLSVRFRDAHAAAAEAAAVNLAPRYVPLVSQGLQFTPSAETRFKAKNELMAYFEVYEPLLAEQPKTDVQVQVRIVDAKTGETKIHFRPAGATPYERPGSVALAFAGRLPVAKLPKGDYRVEVQATDSAGRTTPVRTAAFSIE